YTGAGDATPEDITHEVQWLVDTDDITGVTLYWSLEGYPTVNSPDVDGHAVSHPVIDGTLAVDATTVAPIDTVVRVEYTPLADPTPTPTPTPSSSPAPAQLPLTGGTGSIWFAVIAGLLIGVGIVAVRRRNALG
ncbi:MAG: LPXTG cell wall anchor domain-containing protein, partial [Bifidobacteriaceae bacterium]|nr:LPXTG cell wall anchor domain-containing protein [Bifidobacteriaceae bacterium]